MRRPLTREETQLETREHLLGAADRIFCEHGFHGAHLAQVAREAGHSTGAVYSAFGSKAALFLAVVKRRFDERIAELRQLRSAPRGEERTREAATQWLDRLDRERDWQIALLEFRLHAARDPDLRRRFAEQHRRFLTAAVDVYDSSASGDRGWRSADAWKASRALVALGNGYALERLTDPENLADSEFPDVAAKLMANLAPEPR